MRKHLVSTTSAALLAAVAVLVPDLALPQSDVPGQAAQNPQQSDADYVPPLRGAPAKRVGGASRGATRPAAPLPVIELLAPADHVGQTINASPTLYYFASRPVAWRMQLTISAPLQPKPILEATIPSAPAIGIYPLHLADYHARLEPGIPYTWSVSIVINPKAWSRNIVASAVIIRTLPTAPGGHTTFAPQQNQAANFARVGLWYDAIAAAFDAKEADRHAALGRLIDKAGLKGAARFDRSTTAGSLPQ